MRDNQRSQIEEIISDPELKQQFKKLILERVSVMPDTLRMAVGSMELTRGDITQHIQDEDEIGKQVMEMELEFLRDLASGAVYTYD